jgi:hypothetical protein
MVFLALVVFLPSAIPAYGSRTNFLLYSCNILLLAHLVGMVGFPSSRAHLRQRKKLPIPDVGFPLFQLDRPVVHPSLQKFSLIALAAFFVVGVVVSVLPFVSLFQTAKEGKLPESGKNKP